MNVRKAHPFNLRVYSSYLLDLRPTQTNEITQHDAIFMPFKSKQNRQWKHAN